MSSAQKATPVFSVEIHNLLSQSIYLVSKLEHDGQVGRKQLPAARCICTGPNELWLNPESQPSPTARPGWKEFMRAKRCLDFNNRIVWAADPATHLNAYSFKYLLAVVGASNEDQACTACRIPPASVAMAGNPNNVSLVIRSQANTAGVAGGSSQDQGIHLRIMVPNSLVPDKWYFGGQVLTRF